jgi:hypothetical protein
VRERIHSEYPTEQQEISNFQVNVNDKSNVKSERQRRTARDTASGSDLLLCARRALKPLAVSRAVRL